MSDGTTIFALASGRGRAGVAVVRISGRASREALAALTGSTAPPVPRHASLCAFRDSSTGELLDRGLAMWFPAPGSFTGEDVVELHLHGGRAVVDGVAEALSRLPGLRPAEPGEFSRRAFLNDKMDLTEAEGLADLVDAETAAQRRQALGQLSGGLGALYESWRQQLVRALAHSEADIDFADEADVPEGVTAEALVVLDRLVAEISAHLADSRRGERLRDGLYVAIIGPPNAGKSSLLNALAQRDVAIVAETAGTTRDVIEAHLDLAGYPVIVADTAGLRAAVDAIEGEGVRRALARAEQADLRLLVLDASADTADADLLDMINEDTIPVLNKIDLAAPPPCLGGLTAVPISVKTGAGLATLLAAVETAVTARLELSGGPSLTRARHRAALEICLAALQRARTAPEVELVAEDLRLAARALGRITGRVDVEDILDVVFAEFCIGK